MAGSNFFAPVSTSGIHLWIRYSITSYLLQQKYKSLHSKAICLTAEKLISFSSYYYIQNIFTIAVFLHVSLFLLSRYAILINMCGSLSSNIFLITCRFRSAGQPNNKLVDFDTTKVCVWNRKSSTSEVDIKINFFSFVLAFSTDLD